MYTRWVLSALGMTLLLSAQVSAVSRSYYDRSKHVAVNNHKIEEVGEYKATDYNYILKMEDFDRGLLESHFKLYQGYVKNTNALVTKLKDLSAAGKGRTPEYAGLKRMYGWEFGGMRLHEYYFSNLAGNGQPDKNSALYKSIEKQFGSYDAWRKDFEDTGMIRGIGWVVLYLDPQTGRLANAWINEHDLGHLAGGTPILVMDVWEHAYMPQFKLDRAGYIKVFFDNIDWSVVSSRFNR